MTPEEARRISSEVANKKRQKIAQDAEEARKRQYEFENPTPTEADFERFDNLVESAVKQGYQYITIFGGIWKMRAAARARKFTVSDPYYDTGPGDSKIQHIKVSW